MSCANASLEETAADVTDTSWLMVWAFSGLLCGLGVIGAVLNALVIYGVYGNVRLGTTVNILLIWICTFALLEATVGTTVKIFIFGSITEPFI